MATDSEVKRGYVYILRSEKTDRYYIGSSSDPERRLKEHNADQVTATRKRGPWKKVLEQSYPDIRSAKQIEYRLKRLKSRDILDLIVGSGSITLKFD